LKINIFYDDVDFRLRSSKDVLKLVDKVIVKEKKISGDLNFVITNDRNLKEINAEFLNHDYFTDVIAFGYNKKNIVNGEIYISIETVKRNSYNYKVSLRNEIIRVMIHGTLHLCGYEDNNEKSRLLMREKEDYWLNEYFRGQ
jgi:probable rRNA maturation factor